MAITIQEIIGSSDGNPDTGLTARNKINSNFQNLVDAILSIQVEAGTTSFENLTGKPSTLQGYGITDAASSIHSHEFSTITSKPSTLLGYGILDSYDKTQIDTLLSGKMSSSIFNDLFEKVNIGTELAPVYAIKAKYDFYSIGGITALGEGVQGEGSSGVDYEALQTLLMGSSNAYEINEAFLSAINSSYIVGKLGSTYSLSSHIHNISALTNDSGFITSSELAGYATQSYVTTAVNNIINGAPTARDTLKEISDILDANINSIGDLTTAISSKWTQDNAKISNWDAAFSWGNHSLAGYALSSHNHNSLYSLLGHTHDFASITSKPSTLSGYGITDGFSSNGGTINGLLNLKGTSLTDGATASSEQLTSNYWTLNDGWSGDFINGFTHTNGSISALTNTITAISGYKYLIQVSVTNRTTGSYAVSFGSVSSPSYTGSSLFAPIASGVGTLVITPTIDFNGTLTISLKRITESSALLNLMSSDGISRLEVRSHLNTNANLFIGKNAGKYTTNGFSDSNTAIGNFAFAQNVSGYGNTILGYYAMNALMSGYNNVAIGNNSGRYNSYGSANTYCNQLVLIGNNTYPLSDRDFNEIVIGYGALGKGSNTAVIGNDSILKTYLKGKVYTPDNIFSSGNIYVGDNRVSLADGLPGVALNKAGGIEISGTNPLIDFHFNNSTNDYTSRIVEALSGQLGFDCSVRIGDVFTTNGTYKFSVNGDSNFIGSIKSTKNILGMWTMEEVSGELVIKKDGTTVGRFTSLGFVSSGGVTALG